MVSQMFRYNLFILVVDRRHLLFKNVLIKNNTFQGQCIISISGGIPQDVVSEIFHLLPDDALDLQVRVAGARVLHSYEPIIQTIIFVKLKNSQPNDKQDYIMQLTIPELSTDMFTSTNKDVWQFLGKMTTRGYDLSFTLGLRVDPMSTTSKLQATATPPQLPITFATLHDDDELTDFELRGSDGGVAVHRAALAAASPVLRRMLAGDWRAAYQGHVDVPDVSVETLRYFKDYIYVNVLPESGVEQLLLLASRYMMHDLERHCVCRLVSNMSAGNAVHLIEFASNHKLTNLLIKLLKCLDSGKVNVRDIQEHSNSAE